jgi:trk system potassium uptake protein TrkH
MRGAGLFEQVGAAREVPVTVPSRRPPSRGLLNPARLLAIGFAAVIGFGTLLLTLPTATTDGRGLPVVDALFTATSATCVTGLTVLDVSTVLTTFGQVVLLLLIQVGGLGVMTVTTLFVYAIGRRISLRGDITISESLGQPRLASTGRLVRDVALLTLVVESAGAIILTVAFNADFPLGRALYYGVFHSVSAFCNAGFSLFGPNLMDYVTNIPVNLATISLIIVGGLGFVVLSELLTIRHRRRLSLHSRVVLKATAALTVVGTLSVLAFEFANPATLGALSPGGRFLAALFQSVTPRTAGFNTVAVGSLLPPTLLVLTILMFIGASPGSTGGGIKTTTFVTLLASVRSALRRREDVEMGDRRLPRETTTKAWVITALSAGLVATAILILLATEGAPLLDVTFEAVSAFGTVGLSTGLTPKLTVAGRVLLSLVMFAGRVGPLTLAVALTRQDRPAGWRLPEERVIVG